MELSLSAVLKRSASMVTPEGDLGSRVGDFGAKSGDFGGGNLYWGSVGVMGSVGVWDGWSFGAECGDFRVLWG